jgi:hypothetical protein
MGTGVIAMPVVNSVTARTVVDPVPAVGSINVADQRRETRRCGVDEHGVQRARVLPGIDARVRDLSGDGALIETACRLLPGRRLILQLSFVTGAVAIRSSVLRCDVCHVSADRIAYRGALVFERRLRWTRDASGSVAVLVD